MDLLDLGKVFPIGEKAQISCLHRMFRLVQEALGSSKSVLPRPRGQLFSPYHIRLLTKVLMNHTSNGSLVNLQFSGEYTHRLIKIFNDTTEEFWRPGRWQCSFFLWETVATSHLPAFSSLLKLKTNDRANFKKAAISELERPVAIRRWQHASSLPELV